VGSLPEANTIAVGALEILPAHRGQTVGYLKSSAQFVNALGLLSTGKSRQAQMAAGERPELDAILTCPGWQVAVNATFRGPNVTGSVAVSGDSGAGGRLAAHQTTPLPPARMKSTMPEGDDLHRWLKPIVADAGSPGFWRRAQRFGPHEADGNRLRGAAGVSLRGSACRRPRNSGHMGGNVLCAHPGRRINKASLAARLAADCARWAERLLIATLNTRCGIAGPTS